MTILVRVVLVLAVAYGALALVRRGRRQAPGHPATGCGGVLRRRLHPGPGRRDAACTRARHRPRPDWCSAAGGLHRRPVHLRPAPEGGRAEHHVARHIAISEVERPGIPTPPYSDRASVLTFAAAPRPARRRSRTPARGRPWCGLLPDGHWARRCPGRFHGALTSRRHGDPCHFS
ncbi:hypothetical protein QJS66_22920 [Kocuria rhizophila]|nr:hypothetical protein QJS66_22920 [Kocuria rhizophila]